jgi:nicotinate-nucleotide adenylyltransferase
MKKIGIYGGTFDPVHHAHLILAREAREQLGLETVIFVPAAVSPFKGPPLASGKSRLSMLRAAIEGESGFVIDECELNRPPPSFAIETVEIIKQREGPAEFYYLVGQDNVATLTKWRRFDDLLKLVRFVILDRTGIADPHPYLAVRRKIDISATEIRQRIASRLSIRYLVPEKVEEIICRQRLYQGEAP